MRHGSAGRGKSASPEISEERGIISVQVTWRCLFSFTNKLHLIVLISSTTLSVASGAIVPLMAILLGKVFDSFTEYGTKKISGDVLTNKIASDVYYLLSLGGASWILNGSFFVTWLVFGELQAKRARDKLYVGMLEKEMEWYDMRKAGINAMIPRIQTYAPPILSPLSAKNR